jgi:uncharacterized protein YcfJ
MELNMSKKPILTLTLLAIGSLSILSGCSDSGLQLNNTQTGALTGSALGAGLGAIVGNQSGHPGAGVAIGAGAGAIGGALIGAQGDRSKERADYQEERLRRQEEELRRQRREIEDLRGSKGNYKDSSYKDNRYDRQYDNGSDDFDHRY